MTCHRFWLAHIMGGFIVLCFNKYVWKTNNQYNFSLIELNYINIVYYLSLYIAIMPAFFPIFCNCAGTWISLKID